MAEDSFSITAAMTSLGPLARANLFLFEIYNVPAGGNPQDILFSAETATVPKATNEIMTIPWMNSEYKIPGITKYENISVNFRISENNNMRIYDILYNWYKMIYDPFTGIQQVPASTMADGRITLLNYQGDAVKVWDVINMFPTNFGGTSLDRGNAEKQIMTIDFAFTYAVDTKDVGGASHGQGFGF